MNPHSITIYRLKDIRGFLGLTQSQLAAYLSISRDHFAMIEGYHRSLPEQASEKLSNLKRHLVANITTKIITQHPASVKRKLTAKANECLELSSRAHEKLRKLRNTQKQCLVMLRVISCLQHELRGNAMGKKDRLWLKSTKAATLKKLHGCGIDAQMLLEVRIEGLIAQIRKVHMLNQQFVQRPTKNKRK